MSSKQDREHRAREKVTERIVKHGGGNSEQAAQLVAKTQRDADRRKKD